MSAAKVTTTKKAEREHALLSASGSHRWLHCTPSARLEDSLPEEKSVFADEGTLAHEIAELKLRKTFIDPMGKKTFDSKLKKLQLKPLYQDEMLRHTDTYLEYISGIVHSFKTPPYVAVEKRMDYSMYAPEGFGTSDCTLIGGNTLHVIDFKYGKGVPVFASENTQMMLYALGAYTEYSFLYNIEEVKMVIIQPRLDNTSEWVIPIADLLAWGESIKPIAQKAFNGGGDFVPGDHCGFCRAKATCRARTDAHTALEDFGGMLPPLITNEEVGQILHKAKNLAKWAKDLAEYALKETLKGNSIEGWKAVSGRGDRKFTDINKAFEVLKANGIVETMLYQRKPLTLTATEELVGKAQFKTLLSEYVETPPGKPTLVELNDKREAITRISAADDFRSVDEAEFQKMCQENTELPY
jgi:hypothetical protein